MLLTEKEEPVKSNHYSCGHMEAFLHVKEESNITVIRRIPLWLVFPCSKQDFLVW